MRKTRKGEAMQSDVLRVLRGAEHALSAYDVLNALKTTAPRLAPATIYRALKALCASGQVLRVESLNAYAPRQSETMDAPVILSICDDCGALRESVAPELLVSLSDMARKAGIEPTHHVVEIHGHCTDCGASRQTGGSRKTTPPYDRK
ncbi:transcriptional repressor [Rhodovulum sp. BSW8]|uniref:Transcriptional repressor n=1 Tax=Rhodovulum visakhapatnamense TaxID=364297 RepID=A0ABS1RGH4_9RHOB|nr:MULTISPECIES: Fur family transcriptional regulator [Rhodovulum]MBL3570009.1 transcriptional repressor [Rhodovulum visakhapatnamense]MBL3578756.1 transcriptional repressor [Rhodovulum visakhapatnamense]OLS42370.1 hypothetical protein BV509_20855 [Rhodovulum sulfidophilum]RBO53861.1 transcriptional repressor [Rhodovulum sp. BSW8]